VDREKPKLLSGHLEYGVKDHYSGIMSIQNYGKSFCIALLSTLFVSLTPQVSGSQIPTEKTLLWEISGNGLTKSSYLFGTMHVICTNHLRIGKQQRKALDSVQKIYLEIDVDDVATLIEASSLLKRPGNKSLKELLTPAEYRKVKTFFEKELRTPLWTVENLMISELTSQVIGDDYADCPTSAWESLLVKAAKNRNLEVGGLEEIKEIADIDNQVPIKQQIAELIETIDNRAKLKKEAKKAFRDIQALYLSQDVDKIHKFSSQVSTTDAVRAKVERQQNEAIVDQRNRNWIPRIARITKEQPTFFGVGAAHLGGPQGVIALLRQAGYQVKPLYDVAKK
jgi:uncharacterized protein